MNPFRETMILRKLYHLRKLSEMEIDCVTAAYDAISSVSLDAEDYATKLQETYDALATESKLEKYKEDPNVVTAIEQAKHILSRLIEYEDIETDRYPQWPTP